MSYKRIAAIAGLVILLICGCLVYLRDHVLVENRDIPELTDVSAAYQADDEIAKAKQQMQAGIAPAEVITTLPAGGNCVAIVIDGLPDRPLAARLVDVLQKHRAEATFFVEGQNAADEPETIRLIRDAGFELGIILSWDWQDSIRCLRMSSCGKSAALRRLSRFALPLFRRSSGRLGLFLLMHCCNPCMHRGCRML